MFMEKLSPGNLWPFLVLVIPVFICTEVRSVRPFRDIHTLCHSAFSGRNLKYPCISMNIIFAVAPGPIMKYVAIMCAGGKNRQEN